MPSMPKGCGLCGKATGELPAWEWKDRFIHLKCFLEFQRFIANNLSRSPTMIGAPKRSDEVCLYYPSAIEFLDAGRTLKYTICENLVLKSETVDDEEFLKSFSQNDEAKYGNIHAVCLNLSLREELLRLYRRYGGR